MLLFMFGKLAFFIVFLALVIVLAFFYSGIIYKEVLVKNRSKEAIK